MSYLRIAASLAPLTDAGLQERYTGWLADLSYQLGELAWERADEAEGPAASQQRQAAQGHWVEAAEHYLALAKLTTLNAAESTKASWRAVEAFDRAGERERAAAVLECFVRESPEDARVPEALLRLGQIYQVLGDYERAIARYQQNLEAYATTLYAADCLVNLADCFIEVGALDKAQQTLLRIVDHRPGDALSPIEPEAQVYKLALFRLGDLCIQTGEYESAIARYEEAIERYPDAPETDRSVFMLANAYRLSAAVIREDVKDQRNLVYKDDLLVTHQKRLKRARELFQVVVKRYRSRPASSLTALDKLSRLYEADAIYDLSFVTDAADFGPFAEALALYDRAAWEYQRDPIAMSAYMQMINCHLRMGDVAKARMTLQRARWALRNISDERFARYAPGEGRAFWEDYLAWLEQTPAFAAVEMAEAG
jgi:tetratricopeptide (TPR) repeat protein